VSSALMRPMTERFAADIRHRLPRPGPGPFRQGAEQGRGGQELPGRS
jgi:hypothetical protein